MLTEYSLIPDIFDKSCYSMPIACQIHLQNIKEILLNESLVSNLYSGEWKNYFESNLEKWDQRAKELFRKLKTQNRICLREKSGVKIPTIYSDWIEEAIASNSIIPLTGIIISNQNENSYKSNDLICSIEKLSSSRWWQSRSPSKRLHKSINEYLEVLNLVLKFSNSIMFIDPHINPVNPKYNDFIKILKNCKRNTGSQPLIEVHRVCYEGSGVNRFFPDIGKIESNFRNKWKKDLTALGLKVSVTIWDDFHDRYLISDLIGINAPYGFDTTTNVNSETTWFRLGRSDKESIEREFDRSSGKHELKHSFLIE